ncbi:hypothetical protein ICC_06466 [Bacillus cereus BAG1X1-1]|nr:hypothetical protein ICC_06466 [Bacillus cereus BAG1X1-1]EOO42526.1 hypothetical protein ICI_06462 [Bacillus cereus BAG1X2-1]EOO43856.1 hypothetical protein ICK_06757 [Bacillus cereus BAG1X2-2]EOP00584.1 hypothetical protein ICO_06154 [Bacillus cereus BAG2O-1]
MLFYFNLKFIPKFFIIFSIKQLYHKIVSYLVIYFIFFLRKIQQNENIMCAIGLHCLKKIPEFKTENSEKTLSNVVYW